MLNKFLGAESCLMLVSGSQPFLVFLILNIFRNPRLMIWMGNVKGRALHRWKQGLYVTHCDADHRQDLGILHPVPLFSVLSRVQKEREDVILSNIT